MELCVAAAAKQPGEQFECCLEEAFAPQVFAGRTLSFDSPVSLKARYSFNAKAFTLIGELVFKLNTRCARCDEALTQTLIIPFKERFVKGEGDEESYSYEGDTLSLETMVLDNLYLHLPLKSVCGEDCRGLCPICGSNLNIARCACRGQDSDNPLNRLSALMNDSKEV